MMHDLVLITLNWLFKNLGRYRRRAVPHAHSHELHRVGGADEGDAQGEAACGRR